MSAAMLRRSGVVAVLLAAALLAGGALPAQAAGDRPVPDLPPPIEDGADILRGTAADTALVRFAGGRDWPALRYRFPAPRDWSFAAALAVPVENPGALPVTLLLRLDDDPGADGGDRSLTGLVVLPPRAAATVVLPLRPGPAGMRGVPVAAGPAEPGDRPVTDLRGAVDPRHVVALHLSGVRSADDRVVRIGVPRLREGGGGATGPLADAYGQARAGTWPEKVVGDAELRRALAAADTRTRQLARDAVPSAPAGRATGAVRVEKADGRWRFVAPGGAPFFSLGVDAVVPSNPTVVTGREALFADLPAPGTPFARFLRPAGGQGSVLDVGEQNLARAYGADWRPRWEASTTARLRAWGFNTLGNWSDPRLRRSGLATVAFTDVEGDSAAVPMAGGRALPDPFDPRYPAVADAVAAQMAAADRDAPALLGYFSGNEMPWGEADRPEAGIGAAVLRLGADSPARRAFVADLRARYGGTAALAAAWGIADPGGWEALGAGSLALPPNPSRAARADLAAFGGAFAERYFATVAQALRRHDPRHLYLGTRFASGPPEVVAACARWCDVLSFNVYGASPAEAAARWRAFDRPVLIGEFHFGSLDRGSYWPGMVDAGGEAARGPAYAAYLDAAVRDPQIVGAHWYQYADEPLTGRPYDGENGHIGLVAVTDVPWAGFVEAVAAANRRALATWASRWGHTVRTSP